MERTFYTFLIAPGAQGKLRKLKLPVYVVQLVLALAVVGVATVAVLASSYAKMLLKVSDYNTLRIEREALKTQYHALENVVSETNAKLDSLQSLAAEVALRYGFGDVRRPQFPPSVVVMATGGYSTLGRSYTSSLRAFNLLKTTGLVSPGVAISQRFLLDPLCDSSITPSIWPVRGQITAGFGQRMDPFTGEGAFHAGIDIAAPVGTQVRAVADGILFHAGPDAGYGNEILLDHGYGITTKYGHLRTTYVVVGQEVKRGQIIGAVGMTGRATGPHLHYEVLIHETPVNPAKYLPAKTRTYGGIATEAD